MMSKKTAKARKIFRTLKRRFMRRPQEVTARLLLLIGTMVLLGWICMIGCKILAVQANMLQINNDISYCEGQREYYEALASTANLADQRVAMQSEADYYDSEVARLSAEREALHNSNSSLIAFAAEYDFSFRVMFVAVTILGLFAVSAALFWHCMEGIIDAEYSVLHNFIASFSKRRNG